MININDLVEPETSTTDETNTTEEQLEQLTLDGTPVFNEDGTPVTQAGLDIPLTQETYEKHRLDTLTKLAEDYNEEKEKEYIQAIDDFEVFVSEIETLIDTKLENNDVVKPDEEVIKVNDARYSKVSNEIYPEIMGLMEIERIDDTFYKRLMELNNRLYRVRYTVSAMVEFDDETARNYTNKVDETILNAVAYSASFQFENTLRTLQKARKNNQLYPTLYKSLKDTLEGVYKTHHDYLTWNDIETDALDISYQDTVSVYDKFAKYITAEDNQ